MVSSVIGLAWAHAGSGRLDGWTSLVSLASSIVLTGAVAWYAHSRERAAFLAAEPVGGVH